VDSSFSRDTSPDGCEEEVDFSICFKRFNWLMIDFDIPLPVFRQGIFGKVSVFEFDLLFVLRICIPIL